MAKSENVRFCEGLYRSYRAEAKEYGIELGKITAFRSTKGRNGYWYEVTEEGEWAGNYSCWASCAAEAKAEYLKGRINDYEREQVLAHNEAYKAKENV